MRRASGILAVFIVGMVTGTAVTGLGGTDAAPAWRDDATLLATRSWAQAVPLATGEVLIAGGLDRESADVVRGTAEVFDPRSGRSVPVAVGDSGRLWNTLTGLADGRVLSVGGVRRDVDIGWHPSAEVSTFDPWTRMWRAVASASDPRSDHGATALADGRVLVVGGHRGPTWVRSVEIYDPTRDRWTAAAPLPLGRSQFSIATLPDGRVLVAGGLAEPGQATLTSLLYDPRADAWRPGPSLAVARAIHTTIALPGGDLLLVGGQRAAAGSAERYVSRLGIFVHAGTLVLPRMYAQGAAAGDGSVVIVGGFLRPGSGAGFVPTRTSERWDPATNLWTLGPDARVARAAAATVAIAGAIYLFGGSAEGDHALSSVETFR